MLDRAQTVTAAGATEATLLLAWRCYLQVFPVIHVCLCELSFNRIFIAPPCKGRAPIAH